jgi:hypothetical protein
MTDMKNKVKSGIETVQTDVTHAVDKVKDVGQKVKDGREHVKASGA